MAKHQMEVSCGGNTIPTTSNPKYLGVTLDRSLTYKKHLYQLSIKVNARCNLLRRLAGTKWGAHFDVLQTSTTALAFAPAEYCSPVWCRSSGVASHSGAHRQYLVWGPSLAMLSQIIVWCSEYYECSEYGSVNGIGVLYYFI